VLEQKSRKTPAQPRFRTSARHFAYCLLQGQTETESLRHEHFYRPTASPPNRRLLHSFSAREAKEILALVPSRRSIDRSIFARKLPIPHFAKRTSPLGHQTRGGLGKPIAAVYILSIFEVSPRTLSNPAKPPAISHISPDFAYEISLPSEIRARPTKPKSSPFPPFSPVQKPAPSFAPRLCASARVSSPPGTTSLHFLNVSPCNNQL
jgi:hypothetical protein